MKAFRYFALFSLVLIITGCSLFEKENEFYNHAQDYLAQNEYSRALEQYKLAINEEPKLVAAYTEGADILIAKGRLEDAKALLSSGQSVNGEKEEFSSRLGQISFFQRNFVDCVSYYDKALATSMKTEYLIGKTNCQAFSVGSSEILTAVNTVNTSNLDETGKTFVALMLASTAPDQAKDLLVANPQAELLTPWIDAIAAKQDTAYNQAQLAYYALENNWYGATFYLSDQIISENAFYEIPYLYKGVALMRVGDFEQGLASVRQTETMVPTSKDVRIALLHGYLATGALDKVPALISGLALQLTTETETDFRSVIKLLASYGQNEQALAMLQNYKTTFGSLDQELAVIHLQLLLDSGLYEEVKSEATSLLATNEYDNSIKAKLTALSGYALFKTGDKAAGHDQLIAAQSLDQTLAVIYLYEGEILIDQSNLDEAEEALTRAIDLDFGGEVSERATKLLETI